MTKKVTGRNIFKLLYFGILSLILFILIIGLLQGASRTNDNGASGFLYVFLYAVFLVTPLSIVFFGVNVWGIVAHKERRLYYILVSLVLIFWCYYGINAWINTPFP